VSALDDADWPSERELKVTAVLYARLGAVSHLRETGRLADRIGGMWNSIPMNLVLRERGTDPTLTEEERLVYDAIVREHRLPGGAVRLIGESSPHEEPDAQQVGEVFPSELRTFASEQTWTFAKTMPEWPHEYIVRDRVDEGLFVRLVEHIRAYGYEGRFYQRVITYYEEAGLVYWTMGAPLAETIIINRCRREDTYEERLRRGTLPESRVDTVGDDLALLLRAAAFSADRHQHQHRKGDDPPPYINHPLEVASILANVGGITDVTILVAALLHDTIEDTSASGEELEQRFGPAVRALVEEVTDDKALEKAERKRLQIEHTSALSTAAAKQIKLGDKICNTRDVVENPPTDWSLQKRRDYLDWAAEVVGGCRGANVALERYFDQVLQDGRLALARETWRLDIDAEVHRLFDDSSLPADGQPVAVIISGGVCAGKTTVRKQRYSTGYVLIDAADIFLNLSRGEFLPFPEAFREPMDLIGALVAKRALAERRSIVTEIIGSELEPVQQLVDALESIGYGVQGVVVDCDVEEALRRNESRGDESISAYDAEPFQRAWIIDACTEFADADEPAGDHRRP